MEKILVIGLGSMGKRRLRSLKKIGDFNYFVFDPNQSRVNEVISQNVTAVQNVDQFIKNENCICVISTPPDIHGHYIKLCLENKRKFFVEASVILEDLVESVKKYPGYNSIGFPSCTLLFHPAIREIKRVIENNLLGTISHITYQSGQYLPDWHPYEKVSDYYVSKKETGGAREIVPFELTWICKVFGFPSEVKSFYGKTIQIEGAPLIDDTYMALLSYDKKMFINLTVDVVSRKSIRSLVINGSKAQLKWSWDQDFLIIAENDNSESKITFNKDSAHEGYNKNIVESMYVEELYSFLNAANGKNSHPTNLDYDIKILELLNRIEQL